MLKKETGRLNSSTPTLHVLSPQSPRWRKWGPEAKTHQTPTTPAACRLCLGPRPALTPRALVRLWLLCPGLRRRREQTGQVRGWRPRAELSRRDLVCCALGDVGKSSEALGEKTQPGGAAGALAACRGARSRGSGAACKAHLQRSANTAAVGQRPTLPLARLSPGQTLSRDFHLG